ncbi:MAG: isochorismatase family protein [Berryella intestinalis]|uniref:cysteine hydrolase family protein n=1 Tax=Berryella intestinalis TaxID=1531429 RepID=UPI002A4E30CD|nr:isochorismatase family protein [Berryella intestinalis]MDD7369335.1 isochorismatase family protein [Berryella intestinalis]MDY3128691.1 isochorismatase family protein [Berryella intestinalis]
MKRLLVVVDFQKDFVGGFCTPEGADEVDGYIADKIRAYRDNGDKIIFILDTRETAYLNMQDSHVRPIPHTLDGIGNGLYGQVAELRTDIDEVYFKASFGSSDLFVRLMKAQKVAASMGVLPFASIEVAGLSATRCLLSNVVIARTACPEAPVIVDARCTVARDEDSMRKALDILAELRVDVLNAD